MVASVPFWHALSCLIVRAAASSDASGHDGSAAQLRRCKLSNPIKLA
jgi:hypothetical protein